MPKRKRVKHDVHTHRFIWIALFLLIVLATISAKETTKEEIELHENAKVGLNITSQHEKKLDESGMVFLDVKGDFPNAKEGTFEINLKLDLVELSEAYPRIPRYVVFFESTVHPRLTLRYNLYDSVIEGGLPRIQSGPLNFMDGEMHKVQYTYHQDRGQAILFDGSQMAYSGFDPASDIITGNAVLERRNFLGTITKDFTISATDEYIGE